MREAITKWVSDDLGKGLSKKWQNSCVISTRNSLEWWRSVFSIYFRNDDFLYSSTLFCFSRWKRWNEIVLEYEFGKLSRLKCTFFFKIKIRCRLADFIDLFLWLSAMATKEAIHRLNIYSILFITFRNDTHVWYFVILPSFFNWFLWTETPSFVRYLQQASWNIIKNFSRKFQGTFQAFLLFKSNWPIETTVNFFYLA